MSRSRRGRAPRLTRLTVVAGFLVAGAAAAVACGGGTPASEDAGSAPSPSPAPSPTSPPSVDASDGADRTDGASAPDARADVVVSDAGGETSDGSSDGSSADGSSDASDGSSGDGSSDASDGSRPDAADAAVSDDPFDPASCAGPALTDAAALVKLGGAARLKLADATLMRRSRACSGATPATCGPWGAPVVHTQSLLTYSGGVVTDYKTFSFPTHLILYAQAGAPKLSVRHESDYRHTATTDGRGVVFAFGASPMVNTYPIIYVWDFAPAPNRYDDLQGLLGTRAELHAAERCARLAIANGVSVEIAALYRY